MAQDAPESVVEASFVTSLASTDLGLEAMAVSPNGEWVLVAGPLGFAHLISATDPLDQVELNSGDDDDLNAIDWHIQGQTALLVGDDGTMLRYEVDDHSLSHVPGSTGNFLGITLTSVTWDSSGNWAYIGSEDGSITRFRESGDGTAEYIPLENTRGSKITDMACHHKQHSICVVTTMDDGIGVIDQDHAVYWIPNTMSSQWLDVDCPHASRDRCYAVGQGNSIGVVELEIYEPVNTYVLKKSVEIDGHFTAGHARSDSHMLFQTAPFGWVDWDIEGGTDKVGLAYPWLLNDDVSDSVIRGQSILGTWSDTEETGYAITTYGSIVMFYPPSNPVSEKLASAVAPLVVIVAVPGVALGMVYIMSPKLQKKYLEWSKARRQRKFERAKSRKK